MSIIEPTMIIPDYNPETREHYWVFIVCFEVTKESLNKKVFTFSDSNIVFLRATPQCFYCDLPYSDVVDAFPCLGINDD